MGAPPFRFVPGGAPPKVPAETRPHLARVNDTMRVLTSLVRQPAEGKNVGLLEAAAQVARLVGGGRVIMCKSGKDRTSMGVTLEHGRILSTEHGLGGEEAVFDAVQTMRRRGVRRENVRLNTGKRLFAFNWLQQSMLPEAYRPPKGSAKGGKG